MSKIDGRHLGRSGELLVMSEFLLRGYNVAEPEVDTGDDLLVVNDRSGSYWRIQVKTTQTRTRVHSEYACQYRLGVKQLLTPSMPELTYIFLTYYGGNWRDFLIIPRAKLCEMYEAGLFGKVTPTRREITLLLTSSNGNIFSGREDLTEYLNDWNLWPKIAAKPKVNKGITGDGITDDAIMDETITDDGIIESSEDWERGRGMVIKSLLDESSLLLRGRTPRGFPPGGLPPRGFRSSRVC